MGVKKENIKIIPSDDEFKIDINELERQIKKDLKLGKKPFLILGNLGSVKYWFN